MINIKDVNIIHAGDVTGNYQAFGPNYGSCSGDCTGICVGEVDARPSGCTECTSACVGTCSGDCATGCGDANCENACTLSCKSSCSVDCQMSCDGTCENGCFETCSNGCKESCANSCSGLCQGCTGCSGGCIDVCVNGCKHSCQDVATTRGTHVVVPQWPSGSTDINDEETKELLRVIKEYLDQIMRYDYKRISELDEGVLVHDGDTLAGEIVSHTYDIVQHINDSATRVDVMPEPTSDHLDLIYQYIGDDTETYKDGYFYKCVQVDEDTYEWQQYGDDEITPIDTINLNNLNLVISDFDNRTVRITAAALVGFITRNYKNYWIWKPVIESEGSSEVKTKISWEYSSSGDSTPPESINLADIITGGVGLVTSSTDGIFPHEYFAIIDGKAIATHEFITGKHLDGTPVSDLGFEVLRLTSDSPSAYTINSQLLNDLDARYAAQGQYLDTATAAQTYLSKADAANDYVKTGNAPDPTIPGDTSVYGDDRYVMKVSSDPLDPTAPSEIDAYLSRNDATEYYLTKSEAESTYAHIGQGGITQAQADERYVRISAATTQIPARIATTEQTQGTNGLMTPTDVANISSALSSIDTIEGNIADILDDIDEIEQAISGGSYGYATTDYSTGQATAGVVQIPYVSSVVVGSDGAIDVKDFGATNLIRNSLFKDGFSDQWDDNDAIDTSVSQIVDDTTINSPMVQLAIVGDGEIEQSFEASSATGFTVSILFKKHAEYAKTIEVKIDSEEYQSHTVPIGSGYYVHSFFFDITDSTPITTHTLYIHNPAVSTVTFELTQIMVQSGNKFTGWERNPFDIANTKSVDIISYDNHIAFKDQAQFYSEDVYDETGTVIVHHAGDPINPSSSIIMHKDTDYFYTHITAVHEIDGNIRPNTIPMRIDLVTGKCDINGNAVTAGTLKDNTGELVPTVAELNAIADGSALDLVDQANEITVSTMPTAAEELVGNIYYYTGETTASFTQGHIYHCVFDDPDYIWEEYTGYQRKYKYSLNKTVNNVVTELASVLHVGRFTGINNAEIFNDYVGNTADTVFSHVEGQGNRALQSATHVHIEGAGNTAENGAAYTHIEGAGNTADNSAAYNHIEGTGHKATGSSSYSHIEGSSNTNMQSYGHIEGYDNIGGYYSNHSCGSTMPNGNSLFRSVIVNALPSISDTYNDEMYLVYDSTNRTYTAWDVNWSSGEGVWENNGSISLSSGGAYGHVEGQYNLMGSTTGHVEGSRNILKTSCDDTHIEGANNIVYEGSDQTHVEGKDNVVYNGVNYSHFEGLNNRSGYTGNGSGFTALHMEGQLNIASSGTNNTHMEGYNNAIQLAGGNTAHIEGYMNRPSQTNYSHIEGYKNSTNGSNYIMHVSGALNTVNGGHVGLHVEGKSNVVPYGKSSIDASTDVITGSDVGGHIEGIGNLLELNPNNSSMTVGGGYHIEGDSNKITYKNHQNTVMNTSNLLADDNHLEGGGNSICGGYRNHIEGDSNWLYGGATHVEGAGNKVYRADQGHVEGAYNNVNCASGTTYTLYYLHVEGYSNNVYGVTNGSHIEGQSNNIYSNNNAYQIHVEGTNHNLGSSTHNVSLQSIHVEGQGNSIDSTVDSLSHSHIEGNSNKVIKIDDIGSQYVNYIHIEGYNNQVNANYSHTEGASNKVYGDGYYNHMEGYNNISHGQYDHTEGLDNHNYGTIGHIEGQYNTIGAYDTVGKRVTNYANHCHVEGIHNLSLGSVNHVEGEYNTAYGNYNHIEGYHNESYAHETHTAGSYNINATLNSTVIGQYNEPDNTYDATSIIPSDITITNTSYISTVSGSYGQVVYDGSTTLGVTDYIELPHIPIGFHFAGTNATGGAIAIYDSNKVCLDVIQMTETGTVDIDVTPYSQSNMLIHPNWRDAKYIRLCAVMSTSGLNGAQLFLMKEPHLFIVGNGTFNNSVNPSVTVRSNILEVGLDKININGDIYQNGELFKSGTPHFVGTSIEWAALTSEEKAAYEGGDIVFTDDNAGSGIIDQVVTPDSPNPVSGGAVYTAMANMSNPMTSRSTNGYYTGRKYYDGRTTVHYRRKFTSTSLTANAATRVVLGDWDGIDSSFNTLITNAFSNNNNVTYMTIIKDAMDAHICQINCISASLNDHVAYIATMGTGNYTGEFTIDICIDSY